MTALPDDRDSEILVARARALAQAHRPDSDQDGRELLVAALGATTLAFDVRDVRRVLPPAPLARIPAGDHVVVGLRNVSGELLAVADVAALLGLTSSSAPDVRWVVLLDGHGGPVGVMVDSVDDLVADTATPARPAAGVMTTGVVAETTANGHLLIDADALLLHPSLSVGRSEETTHQEETA